MPNATTGNPISSQVIGPIVINNIPSNNTLLSLVGIMKDGTQATTDMLSNVQWSSSDPSIAEVIDGYLCPFKDGVVTITATVDNLTTSAIIIIGELQLDRLVVSHKSMVLNTGNICTINRI